MPGKKHTMKRSLFKSIACAFRGIYLTFKSERNFRVHLIALCVAVGLGLYLRISITEWCLIIFAIGFVLTAELFNTALERWCDEASGGKQSEIIRNAKDVSGGAVLLSAITALIIGIYILIVPLIQRIAEWR